MKGKTIEDSRILSQLFLLILALVLNSTRSEQTGKIVFWFSIIFVLYYHNNMRDSWFLYKNYNHISLGMCTGNFQEEGKRPPAGIPCVGSCVMDAGRWGSSYCYVDSGGSQWGAECVYCSG